MSKFAIVVLMPESPAYPPNQANFLSREVNSIEEMIGIVKELEDTISNWRIVSFCHVEDLPLLMDDTGSI